MKNGTFESARTLSVVVPSGTLSGDPVVYGTLPGVAETNRRTDTTATVRFGDLPVVNFNVKAQTTDIAPGDQIYYHSGSTPKLDNIASGGTKFGKAHGALAVGTGTLLVIITGA